MSSTARKSALQTTTVRLPKRLYEAARSALEKGETSASSLNDLLVESLEEKRETERRAMKHQSLSIRHEAGYHAALRCQAKLAPGRREVGKEQCP